MIQLGNISNRYIQSLLSIFVITLIGIIDWETGYEFSLSIFYLIPIVFFALIKNVNFVQIVINAVYAAFVWFSAYINPEKSYSHFLIPYWETFAILAMFLLVSILIYKLKNEHKDLIESNKKLRLMNEEKNVFLGIAAHDLRSPLAGISGITNLLINDNSLDKNETSQFLKLINDASEKSLTLLSNLLDVSRIEAGIVNIKLQPHNYYDFINRCIANNRYFAKQKNIDIDFTSKHTNLIANIDPIYFEEVINNLISNAIKYSYPNSQIHITVGLSNNRILTEIEDSGVGIPDDEIDSLFSPFYKSSAKPTQGEPSTGLGLAIVKKIILLHNGEVGLKSKVNEGTNVFFYIPIM